MTASDAGYVVEAGSPAPGRWRALWSYRGLLWSFTLREVQVRYRQAALGALWAVLQPIALAAVTTLVFHHALHVDGDGTPYALFVFTALVPWSAFHTAVTGAVPTLVNNAGLVRKIWFPREVLPLATVLAVGTDLAAGLLVWLLLLLVYGVGWHLTLLWVLPLVVILGLFAGACALAGAAINVRFRDVKHGLPLLLQLLFFATPIVYPLSVVPAPWQRVLDLHPLTCVVVGLRDVGLHGVAPDAQRTLLGALAALALFVLAAVYFLRAERRFADVV